MILSDSFGRELSSLTGPRTSSKICAFVKPSAGLGVVVESVKELSSSPRKDDYLLVLTGKKQNSTVKQKIL